VKRVRAGRAATGQVGGSPPRRALAGNTGRERRVVLVLLTATAAAAEEEPVVRVSRSPFAQTAAALEQAIADHGLTLVCHANAQRGAAARGLRIPGNQVFLVFRNDLAVRLIQAEPRAAYEAPIRIYLHENPDGTATIVHERPSRLFQRYAHPEVARVGTELDAIFAAIIAQALAAP
jgi:uncharacterized protein (DUF302 family)